MQAAFTYYYYILNEPRSLTVSDIFNLLDLDRNGVLCDRELRLLIARSGEVIPITLEDIKGLENEIKSCGDEEPGFGAFSRFFSRKKVNYCSVFI